jgi:hypothetical protein
MVPTRLTTVTLAKFFDGLGALAIMKPETFVRRLRSAFKMFWRWKSREPGHPVVPKDICELVRHMALETPTWGESESRMSCR